MQVYISSCTREGGIYRYKIENDKLCFVDKTAVSEPKYTAVYGDRLYILKKTAYSDCAVSGLISYKIGDDGSLYDPSEVIPTGGVGSCSLDINENGIYIASYYSGSISRINDGRIDTVTRTGRSSDIFRQTHPYVHFVKVLKDTNIVICDLGCDKVALYDKDLSLISEVSVPKGTGPRHLVCSEDEKKMWVLSEMGSTLTSLTYDGKSLTEVQTIDLYPERMREVPHTKSAAIRLLGDTVYTSNRGFDVISIIDVSTEKMRLCSEVSCGGGSPRDFNISPDGKYLVSANETGTVTLFSLEKPKNPKLIDTVSIDAPLCVSFGK